MLSYQMQNNIFRQKIRMTVSHYKNIFKKIAKYHKLLCIRPLEDRKVKKL